MGIRILVSNDDGWDKPCLRALYQELTNAGHDVVLSAPLIDNSGKGVQDEPPDPEEGDTIGADDSDKRLNWVRSFPVTAAKHGLDETGPKIWKGGKCDMVVSGPNEGWNTGTDARRSGTIRIAMFAASKRKIPAIAVSVGCRPKSVEGATLYVRLVDKLVDTLIKSGQPYLPEGVWLSINIPPLATGVDTGDLKWVLTRIEPEAKSTIHFEKPPSAIYIDRLLSEQRILKTCSDCITVSINTTVHDNQIDCASREDKLIVKEKLKEMLEPDEPDWLMALLICRQVVIKILTSPMKLNELRKRYEYVVYEKGTAIALVAVTLFIFRQNIVRYLIQWIVG